MVKIAFVEDDKKYRDLLSQYLNVYISKNKHEFSSLFFSDGEKFLASDNSFDIVCFDIDLPGMNGMETAKKLREKNPECVILFITNLAQYAIKGYEVEALDFAVKPLSYPDFEMKMNKAQRYLEKKQNYQVSVDTIDGTIALLNTDDILYVEVIKHYLTYHTKTKDYVVRGTMKKEENKLKFDFFFRTNSGFLVNMKNISQVDGDTIYIGKKALPIS